jgi:hypothetical protein
MWTRGRDIPWGKSTYRARREVKMKSERRKKDRLQEACILYILCMRERDGLWK